MRSQVTTDVNAIGLMNLILNAPPDLTSSALTTAGLPITPTQVTMIYGYLK